MSGTGAPTSSAAEQTRVAPSPAAPSGAATRVWLSPRELDVAARRAFGDMVPYCLPGVYEHFLTQGAKPAVHFTLEEGGDGDRVVRLLDIALARTVASAAPEKEALLDRWDLPVRSRGDQSADLSPVGEGLFVGGPGIARLAQALENAVLALAARTGAAEFLVPHLVSWETLERAGYARHFPQHVTACRVVGPDLDALDRFAAAEGRGERGAELRDVDVCVAPAVCLHLFARLASSTLHTPLVATARGACGRYEAGARGATTRLWSFSMRELVYVGDRAGAETFRQNLLDALIQLADALDLPCRIEPASDPFFIAERSQMTEFQEKFDVKYELRGRLASNGSAVAVSSLNCHSQHFGAAFDIRLPDGSPAHSVCAGFGLDRWAQWLHGWFGDDPRHWPAFLRKHAHEPSTWESP